MAKMNIQPIELWVQGESKTAEVLEVRSNYDNYESEAMNYYELREADVVSIDMNGNESVTSGAVLSNGNLPCTGQDYIDWDNSNEWIKAWVAAQLNLTIV
jgi:flagellar basal body L-ring protein FlgH